ncbi:hypothetical protein [Streptomyces sp. NPDC051997]|uniref:hypothetical protein n=1 Tax=Streptomyces sp. NPDC051997 TaxID=3155611 RepID=UPI003443E87A
MTAVANLVIAAALIVLATRIYRARPAATRITAMPTELTPAADEQQFTAEDREFIADLTDRMRRYGSAAADRYDTEGNQ